MKTAFWTSSLFNSAEYFTLIPQSAGFHLKGTVNLLLENQPTQLIYHITCDLNWVTRKVEIQQRQASDEKHLTLTVDDALNWYSDGALIPWAAGLTDVDLSVTPSTNMLPLRKHALEVGRLTEVNCVWVQPPTLALSTLPQHYTRLDAHQFDYAAPSLDYKARLSVDADGIIVSYGDLFIQPGKV
jgi:uncharacterized protein